MTTLRRAIPLALAAVLAGCYFGQTVAQFEPARGPRGIAVTITTQAWKNVIVELIEVRDEGLLVDSAQGVARVPYAIIESAVFAQTGIHLEGGRPPAAKAREKLRLLSRFPQGVSPDLLKGLLETRGQSEVTRVAR
jgi:hypothetical protein